MFHSRAQFSATVYQKRLTSLLLQAGVAPSYGYQHRVHQRRRVHQPGHRAVAAGDADLQLRNGFTWVTTVTVSRNYSVVNALPVPPFGPTRAAMGLSASSFLARAGPSPKIVNPSITGPTGFRSQNGDAYPAYTMSLGNDFTWKGFRVYGFLDWSRGGNTFNSTDFYFDDLGHSCPPTRRAARRRRESRPANHLAIH